MKRAPDGGATWTNDETGYFRAPPSAGWDISQQSCGPSFLTWCATRLLEEHRCVNGPATITLS